LVVNIAFTNLGIIADEKVRDERCDKSHVYMDLLCGSGFLNKMKNLQLTYFLIC